MSHLTVKTRGLTLGKYAPLHKGHQHVIETALAEMDEVVVLIYDAPETTQVPLTIRANWLRTLYPTVRLIEAWDGPTEVGYTAEIKRKHEDYILKKLGALNITHFYSSEPYGEHMSEALTAENRQVDPERTLFPTSGTQLRHNLYHNRQFVDPIVYRDLITNVVFLGAPSTGKTTIAERLAKEFNTVWMPEYGREYWETHQIERRLTPTQLVDIATGHLAREEQKLLDANRYLFTDTNAMTTYLFAHYYHGSAHLHLTQLAQTAAARYDLVFLCDTDIPYDDTWDRSGNTNRLVFQKQIIADLQLRKVPYITLNGDIETRVSLVKKILAHHHKYQNLTDLFSQLPHSI